MFNRICNKLQAKRFSAGGDLKDNFKTRFWVVNTAINDKTEKNVTGVISYVTAVKLGSGVSDTEKEEGDVEIGVLKMKMPPYTSKDLVSLQGDDEEKKLKSSKVTKEI